MWSQGGSYVRQKMSDFVNGNFSSVFGNMGYQVRAVLRGKSEVEVLRLRPLNGQGKVAWAFRSGLNDNRRLLRLRNNCVNDGPKVEGSRGVNFYRPALNGNIDLVP